jgi:hypothetical protein
MAAEGIVNFDSYAWLAVGLFITGLLAVMVYEKSTTTAAKTPRSGIFI